MSQEQTEIEETRALEIHLDKAYDQLAMTHSLSIVSPEGIIRISKIQDDLMQMIRLIQREDGDFDV